MFGRGKLALLVGLEALVGLWTGALAQVVELTPATFDKVVLESKKPALVEFYAPWCGHCKNLEPIYDKLGKAFMHASDRVTIAKVNADAHRDLGQRFQVEGFPTLKWFDGKSAKPEAYQHARDLESLSAFVTRKTNISPKQAPASKVVSFSGNDFKKQLGGEKNMMILFTSPWCKECKALLGTMEKVATDFERETDVVVAKLDVAAGGNKAVGEEQKVTEFPTMHLYPAKSKKPIPFKGKTESEMVKFLNSKLGTDRKAGGGSLGTKAGIVASLNKLAGRVGRRDEGAFEELKEAVEKILTEKERRSADYYLRVAEKLQNDRKYVEQEIKRLKGIVKKGSISGKLSDSMTTRINILGRFAASEDDHQEHEEGAKVKSEEDGAGSGAPLASKDEL